MRIRSTKPEFWSSERIARLTWDARLVLKGLESYVDDNGVGRDDIALIVADVFPRDHFANPRETVARVSEAISELHRHGFVHRYSDDGTDLLYLSWWDTTQRIDKPGKGRLRRPDGTLDYKESVIRESVASPPETLAPGTGEQGNRGTGEQVDAPAPTSPPEALALCEHLADRIEGNGSKRPTIGKGWHDAARLLLDRDGRDLKDAHRLIDWCQDSDFWKGNILSMPKFREKYDQLRLQAENVRAIRPTGTTRPAGVPEGW